MPEPCTGYAYLGLFFMEVVFFIEGMYFVFDVFQGRQSPLAWCYSLSQDTTEKGGGCLLRSSQHAGTGAASRRNSPQS